MKLDNKYSWTDRFRKGAGSLMLATLLLFTVTVLEAADISVKYKGCRAGDNGYVGKMVPDVHYPDPGHPEEFKMYFCDQTAYTTGDLATWNELDLVPFQLIVENKSGSDQNFTFNAGGAYEPHGTNPGWDYISEFTLDVDATIAAGGDVEKCKERGAKTSQEIIIENGTIERRVTVENFPAGLICVPHFNMRLALGASSNSGSSLHAYLETEEDGGGTIGTKTVSIKVGPSAAFDKTMTAVQDGAIDWTITKTSTPANIKFDDTCSDDESALVRDVDIVVTWTKGEPSLAGEVKVTTVISATNAAQRPVAISVVDTLYSGATELEIKEPCTKTLLADSADQAVCTHTFTISEGDAVNLNDKAVATFSDPDHPVATILAQKEATASADVQNSGSNNDGTAVIKDNEWLVGDDMNYSVESVTGANGSFSGGYALKEITNGDINWTSETQTEGGSVVFSKKIYAAKATSVSGHLGDIALVEGSDGFYVATNALNVPISSSANVSLTINKSVNQDIIDENKDLAFDFRISKAGVLIQIVTINIPAGNPDGSIEITGMEPGNYKVEEISLPGYATVGDNVKDVNLTLPTCKTTVDFANELAGRPAVKVKKVTSPRMIGDEDQAIGWTMTLQRETSTDVWEDVNVSTTIGYDEWLTLVSKNHLIEGHYRIIETPKTGWYNVGVSPDCDFEYVTDALRDDYECTFGNAKYAKIIINKVISSVQTYDEKFGFDQNIDDETLILGHNESKTYVDVPAAIDGRPSSTFKVSENDPAPDFALDDIVCKEYYAPGVLAIENSTVDLDQHREATIVLDPGETVECTFTNIPVEDAKISISKSTNEADADVAPGPEITVGDPVTWEYLIQNTGNVNLINISVTDNKGVVPDCQGQTTLAVGESITCTASGTAVVGQYSNIGTVTAKTPENAPASDSDPSHYLGKALPVEEPSITIEKSTNGVDADVAPGADITVGSAITWRYVVYNNGNVSLDNISVTDNQGVVPDCQGQTTLAAGESMTCTASGTAEVGPYSNIGTVTAKTPMDADVSDEDTSHYLGVAVPEEDPSIKIEKSTNGVDADAAPGPYITVGDNVNWSYVIYNSGDVTLDTINIIDSQNVKITCEKTTLIVGESMTCTASGTAVAGQYENIGTVTARSPKGATVSAEDPSHYFGEEVPAEEHPSIDIEKLTNGEDADGTAGPTIPVGATVTWTYIVHNTGDVLLSDITVTDDQGVEVSCPQTTLAIDEEMRCTASGVAVEGPYTNVGTVTSKSPEGSTTTDSDTSHYLGEALPSITMEKSTNGEDADVAPGPYILVGDTITWEYIVTNNGNVSLDNIVVTDDKEGQIDCPSSTLEVGESMTCTASGIATVGQYVNVGTVTSDGDDANDTSHYFGTNEAVDPGEDENCPCNDVKSDSSSALNTISSTLMILMTLMLGLFFVRREELNTNER